MVDEEAYGIALDFSESNVFQSVRNRRVFEEIVAQIQERILSGKLKAGDKLPPERELVSQFGASRVTVREALKILERDGLVKIKVGLGGGAFITEAKPGLVTRALNILLRTGRIQLQELQEARIILEPSVAALAAKTIDEDHLEMLRANIRMTRDVAEQGKPIFPISSQFHRILAQASRNFFIEVIFRSLSEMRLSMGEYMIDQDFARVVIREHEAIVEALERHDPEAARKTMKLHVERMLTLFIPTGVGSAGFSLDN